MKAGDKARRVRRPPPRKADVLPQGERSELQRQGAKAAARGEEASSNPMHEASNMPTSTGESADTWRQRQEAWQQGHAAQSKTPEPDPSASQRNDDEHD